MQHYVEIGILCDLAFLTVNEFNTTVVNTDRSAGEEFSLF